MPNRVVNIPFLHLALTISVFYSLERMRTQAGHVRMPIWTRLTFLPVTAPDGTIIIDDQITIYPYLIKYRCRAEYSAPEYAAWGAES